VTDFLASLRDYLAQQQQPYFAGDAPAASPIPPQAGPYFPAQGDLAQTMTHQAERPNPAQPYLDAATRFGTGAYNALMAGPRLMGDVMQGGLDPNSPEAIRRSFDAVAPTAGAPVFGAGRALGAAPAAMKSAEDFNAYRQMARPSLANENFPQQPLFNWNFEQFEKAPSEVENAIRRFQLGAGSRGDEDLLKQSGLYAGLGSFRGPVGTEGAIGGVPKMTGAGDFNAYRPPAATANENLTPYQFMASEGHAERASILDRLIKAKDFNPSLADGRMKFKSLTPGENEEINRIGYSRAPDVTWEQETSPFTAPQAWEKNLRYWHGLSIPPQ